MVFPAGHWLWNRFLSMSFFAQCVVEHTLGPHRMEWELLHLPGGVVELQRSFESTPLCHSVVKEIPLLDVAGQPIYRYGFYTRLLTKTAWRVLVLHGFLPRVPPADATPYQKGIYALLLLVLFRPFSLITELVVEPHRCFCAAH